MLLELYKSPTNFHGISISPEFIVIDASDIVDKGIVKRSSVVKSVSVAKDYHGFSIHDFDISTIISTGSDSLLRPTIFRNTDYSGVTENMMKTIKMFDENEKAV